MTFMRLGLLTVLLSTSVAFALPTWNGEYSGEGTWTSDGDYAGTFNTKTLFTVTKDGGFTIKETLTIHTPGMADSVEETEWSAVPKANAFFNVVKAGKVTGEGVCDGKTCMFQGDADKPNSSFSETVTEGPDGLVRMGQEKGDGYHIAWKGIIKKN